MKRRFSISILTIVLAIIFCVSICCSLATVNSTFADAYVPTSDKLNVGNTYKDNSISMRKMGENGYAYNVHMTEKAYNEYVNFLNKKAASKKAKYFDDFLNLSSQVVETIISLHQGKLDGKEYYEEDTFELAWDISAEVINFAVGFLPVGGDAISSVINLIKSFLFVDNSPSETERMMREMDIQFAELSEQIDDVIDALGNLSSQLNEQTYYLESVISQVVTSESLKQQITNFTSGREGNFNFSRFKNYVLGNVKSAGANYSEQFNSRLIGMNKNPSAYSDEEFKEVYDNLYNYLTYADSSNQSPMDIFYDYLTSNNVYNSIQHYYYEYLLLSGDIEAVEKATKFALDLYETYTEACCCVLQCNIYQLNQIINESLMDISLDPAKVRYNGDKISRTIDDILVSNEQIKLNRQNLDEQFVQDLCYILSIENSYVIESDGELTEMKNTGSGTFGMVSSGQTVYLNHVADAIIEKYEIEPYELSYEYTTLPHELKIIGNINEGVFKIEGELSTPFAVTYKYDKGADGTYIDLYTITFASDKTSYIGGDGTKANPYYINSEEQFLLIAKDKANLGKNYKLYCDLDFSNTIYKPIGDIDNPFTGTFDGNGYVISGIYSYVNNTAGVFGHVSSEAVIENLTLKDCEFNADYHSNVINYPDNMSDKKEFTMYAGAVAGVNYGTIQNCKAINCKVVLVQDGIGEDNNLFCYAGGICGINFGDVIYCVTDGGSVNAKSSHKYSQDHEQWNLHDLFVGGVSGKVQNGSVQYSAVSNKTVLDANVNMEANMKGAGNTMKPYIKVFAGGIAGELNCGVIENVYSDAEINSCEYTLSKNKGNISKNNCKKAFGKIVGEVNGAVVGEALDYIPLLDDMYEYEFTVDTSKVKKYYNYGEKFDGSNLLIKADGTGIDSLQTVFYYDPFAVGEQTVVCLAHIKVNSLSVIKLIDIEGVTFAEESIKGLEVISLPDTTVYELGDKFIIDGLVVYAEYYGGRREIIALNAENIITESPFFKRIGSHSIIISYGGAQTSVNVNVVHKHSFNDEVHSVKAATCASDGYITKICTCPDCGQEVVVSIIPATGHSEVPYSIDKYGYIEGARQKESATCKRLGYSGDGYCVACGSIVSIGEPLHTVGHEYSEIDGDENYHICILCNERFKHQFVSKQVVNQSIKNGETVNVVNTEYDCIHCGYHKVLGDREFTTKLIVSSEHSLMGGEALVLVQIFNNPGIQTFDFSLTWDEELTLDSYSWCIDKLFVQNTSKVTAITKNSDKTVTYQFRLSLWREYDENGAILKLKFKVPKTCEINHIYGITLSVNTLHNITSGGLGTDIYAEYEAINGGIIIVSRLPGDVNNDGRVDVADAIAILNNTYVNFKDGTLFADVNLDGSVDSVDATRILSYINGYKNVTLLSRSFIQHFDDQNGNIYAVIINDDGIYGNNVPVMPEREGYIFLGWSYNRIKSLNENYVEVGEGKTANYNWQQSASGQVLYGQWQRISYVVKFDINGGDPDSLIESTQIFDYSEKDVLKSLLPKRKGYNFVGWFTTPDVGGELISGNFNPRCNLTLYARWIAIKQSILLDNDNASGVGAIQNVVYGEHLDDIDVPIKAGYDFLGYYAGISDRDVRYFDEQGRYCYGKGFDIEIGDAGFILYAHFSAKIIKVILDDGYGSGGSEAFWLEYGSAAYVGPNLNQAIAHVIVPVADGRVFNGYYTEADVRVIDSSGNILVYDFTTDDETVIRAQYNTKTFVITLDINETSIKSKPTISSTLCEIIYGSGKIVQQPSAFGYKFCGYYTMPIGGIKIISESGNLVNSDGYVKDFNWIKASDITLYAHYSANMYSVVYNGNGATSGTTANSTVTYGVPVKLTANGFTKSNSAFIGWALSSTGAKVYNDLAEIDCFPNVDGGTIELWAVWIATKVTWSSSMGKKITDSDGVYDYIMPNGFDLLTLRQLGYKNIKISLNFNMYEINDGYQDVWFRTLNNNAFYEETVEHGRGKKDTSTWSHSLSTTVSIYSYLSDTGGFKIEWGAHGSGADDWWLGKTTLTFEALK